MVKIIKEQCIGCGQCINDCFAKNITMIERKASIKGSCMECGHCFAICPVGAVQMDDVTLGGVVDFSKEARPRIDSTTLLNYIKARRSIRQYKDKLVPKEIIEHILEAGRFTPTGCNAQDVSYTVVQEHLKDVKEAFWKGFPDGLKVAQQKYGINNKLMGTLERLYSEYHENPVNDGLFFKAPVLLIISSPSVFHAGLAASNIELMACSEGLGALYSGFIRIFLSSNRALCDELHLKPENICACMLMGYPDVHFQRTAPKREAAIQWV